MSDPDCPKCHGLGKYDDAEPGDISFNTWNCDCRISRNKMLMMMTGIAAMRSTCIRKKVGCVIAQDGRPVAIGYAGAPARMPHCLNVGCLPGPDGGCIRTVHAEANAIAFAARKGIVLENATLFCTMSPCYACSKLIINAGIGLVYYKELYRDTSGVDLLHSVGIAASQYHA
jgi:dCMP deaminase